LKDAYHKIWTWPRIIALIVITALGSGLHFVWEHIYQFGWAQAIAPFVPVNESLWEHLKLAAWPLIIWYIIEYFYSMKGRAGFRQWFAGAGAGLWSAFVAMIASYTFLKGLVGNFDFLELPIAILSFLFTVFIGILMFFRASRSKKAQDLWGLGLAGLILMVAGLAVFSYWQPHIELFRSSDLDYYGQAKPGT
jgi:hypothetical protein